MDILLWVLLVINLMFYFSGVGTALNLAAGIFISIILIAD